MNLSKLLHEVNLSSVSDTSPITATLGKFLTPTFAEFSTTFSTPVLQMREGKDEICPPEYIWWLFCPLTSPLLSPFLLLFACPFHECPFLILAFALFFPSLSYPLFVDLVFFFFFFCFPEASFNKAVMMQTYFGCSHVCLLGLIIAKPSSSSSLSSSSSHFTAANKAIESYYFFLTMEML